MPLPDKSLSDPAVERNFRAHETRLNNLTNHTTLEGARDDPEDALANLIVLLEAKGILTDSTTAS